jgi:DNA-binding IclR family transcriptional regulator
MGREELELGLVAVAAPVHDLGGRSAAAVSVSGPSFRMSKTALSSYSRYVVAAAAAISRAFGHPVGEAMLG